ncbi:BTAD domain-containing putative transcriptional regulator [Mycobacterium sp.]|uniref:BTAD domain-containing putative transcriptional regulator n=1 Tax=Mycobacterium sp. TaxID=1785 RepID=UPI003BAF6F18
MLGLHNASVVSADTLVELLWGDAPPRTAAKALQTHISSLRRVLGDGVVATEGVGWALQEAEVDASRYKAAAKEARDAAATGDISQAVARFEEALALWRGIPELPDGRRGTSEKTRWIEGHAALVEDRADALLATGRAAEVVGELEAAVAEAPLRERRWGQLMLALYRVGRQGDALGAYQRARTLLADELGIDPGPELRRLETAIVAQDATLDVVVAQQLPSVMRAVTFLLTDIEGSTAAWEADAAAMAVALARHDELVEQVVTSRGGRLIKTRGEGDATFSVFERPSAAAAAALELQDAITHEQWDIREPMRIRIALHTGEVELRDGDYFGRAVNRAARLRSLAIGGQILCSGATAELVIDSLPDDVVLGDLGMRQLKNLARPEHVFELRLDAGERESQGETSETPIERPALPTVLTGAGPFVGRGRELERLVSAWQTALTGRMHAVLIAGEPGVGKTRLAGEWSQQAYEQGAVVLYGRCDEDLGAPYQPFSEALRSLVPCLGTSRLRGTRGVEALLPVVTGLTDVLPDLAAPTRADPDTERYALFDAVVALLETASASAPVVLILDDLHWAAKPTLLLLRHLLRFGDHARVQIVGTYRSTDLDRAHPLAAMLADLHRDGTANRLALTGLDEDDVTTYVAEAGYDDEELGRALASVTGGNPFFLIEALRHVDESGGVWDPSTLPQGVREAVSRRLSRLTVETNKALGAAAVVGSRFSLDLVEKVVEQDLVDAFDEACKAGIVIEEPGGRYRFNHALVRQSLLAELPSVRRMRLHQRIATTLEAQPGAGDELLDELAHHYFECAWAGNAAKAVEYCRRAADQAMARLGYEGAADLYDHALHALEELDDELPDRDDQAAELLVARCEALLAAGDVAPAVGAVSQLQEATTHSGRLAAWATCFDGQLSMLIHPERLDEVETALGTAANKLAELDDPAGEAKAHTVRASCLARLGRIGDCEVALDDALTAARRARDHRRVNAVLAGAPLAALWGPNPVPRAGGRCLDVVRLLRITTDSPAVEATSTRCQAVLEAFRGRAAAARRMIDSARRTVTELGLRHALLEVEQFAGIVELVLDDPAAAEPHLRKAYKGFRRMGLDADTAETAALLGRACLALDRDTEADELCSESERLAGHALKPSIAWRTVRAQLLSHTDDHKEARRVAEAAVNLAERTDALVDHGDACLALAMVLSSAGDVAGARTTAERAANLYDRKGAAALTEKARRIFGERPETPAPPKVPSPELSNACVQAASRLIDAVNCEALDEVEQLLAPYVSVESRRKIVGFPRSDIPSSQWPQDMRGYLQTGMVRYLGTPLAVRGDRLALFRLEMGTADLSSGAPQDEMLQVAGLDEEGRIALQVKFDIEDMDAALAELDAAHARFEDQRAQTPRLDNACVRAIASSDACLDRGDWDEFERRFAADGFFESRRKMVGFSTADIRSGKWQHQLRGLLETGETIIYRHEAVAVRGQRFALYRAEYGTPDVSPGAARQEVLQLFGIDEDGLCVYEVWFDSDDMDLALAELDAAHARFEGEQPATRQRLENAATQVYQRMWQYFEARDWAAITEMVADDELLDDRRRVVNSGMRRGREAGIEELRAAADIGFTITMVGIIAARGDCLALVCVRASGRDPDAIQNDVLQIVQVDADERIAVVITFDSNDFDAAVAELDARYLAGEAAAHSPTWLAITQACAALNRHELPATKPDFVDVDHRPITSFGPGDLMSYLAAAVEDSSEIRIYIETVHRISDRGAVTTHVATGTSREGLYAEWRMIDVFAVEDGVISSAELFDEADLDAAIDKFDELSRPAPRLENAAIRVYERLCSCVAAGDWDVVAQITAEDVCVDDRRRVVNAGVQHGRDANIKDAQATVDVGFTLTMVGTLATRGERLTLSRVRVSGSDPGTIQNDGLNLVEIDAEERIAAIVVFDLDDFEAAFDELDARYCTGEAAEYGGTWSVITEGYAAINRGELPRTTPDWVNIDHRLGTSFAPGDLPALLAEWKLAPDVSSFSSIEVVHRLNNRGAVIISVSHETSHEGIDAEWRTISVVAVEGDLINRLEVFDEAELDAAIARFDQLNRSSPSVENAASRAAGIYLQRVIAHDWDAIAEMLAADFSMDDRRHVVGGGIHRRDTEIVMSQVQVDLGLMRSVPTVIAVRGERLALNHVHHSGRNQELEPFVAEMLVVVELNTDDRIAAAVAFDLDEFDAAIEELDARYLAGEAAAHVHVWSTVSDGFTSMRRYELPPTTSDCVSIDHRRTAAFAPGELNDYFRAAFDLTTDLRIYIETVHRLNDVGAVCTHVTHGASHEGFEAEWREVDVLMVEGNIVNRCEVFDEADLDSAIACFDELQPQTRRLENAATQVAERFWRCFAARDWDGFAETLADDYYSDDRRAIVGSGTRYGRDRALSNMQAMADLGFTNGVTTVLAIRGRHLCLVRSVYTDSGQAAANVITDVLGLVEVNADDRATAIIVFALDDFDTAIAELDARYLAGEAADHAETWSVIAKSYAGVNRQELPPTTSDWENVDHRRAIAFAPGDLEAYLRTTFDNFVPDLHVYVEVVHQLSNIGAVVTRFARGTSRDGLQAEWREIGISTVSGDLITHSEMFDETDLDAALARFEELNLARPRLENAASQAGERYLALFAAQAWDAMAGLLADEYSNDDRRRVVGAGVRHGRDAQIADMRTVADLWTTNVTSTVVATRGGRLALMRLTYSDRDRASEAFLTEALGVLEINADGRIAAVVFFDRDNIDAAFNELDARYVAGEAAAHSQTWSVIAASYAAFNRHDLPVADWVTIDRRRATPFESSTMTETLRAIWDLTPDLNIRIETVHRLNRFGAVITHAASGTSPEGFEAEWRAIDILTVDDDRITGCEIFDEADLDAALARFDELCPPTPQLENAARRVYERMQDLFVARDEGAIAEILADDIYTDDRRRIVGVGAQHGRDAVIAEMSAVVEVGVRNHTSEIVATRGEHLVLSRARTSGRDQHAEAFHVEALDVIEIDTDERVVARVVFDPDDIVAALEELDARYLAGEAADRAHTWTLIAGLYAALNRHELPARTPDFVDADHRRLASFAPGDIVEFTSSAFDQIPDISFRIEAVHRLSNSGAVVTQALRGTSRGGFEAEWREIHLTMIEGDLFCCSEIFDEADTGAAIARFDELQPQTRRPTNAASQVNERFWGYYAAREWDAMARLLATDISSDDRRRVVNAGIQHGRDNQIADMRALAAVESNITVTDIATRGERLVLTRVCSSNRDLRHGEFDVELLAIAEIDADDRIAATILFDANDFDAAFEELDARYVAGEASAYADTWSVIAGSFASFVQHQLPAMTPDSVFVDHRPLVTIESVDLAALTRSVWDVTPDGKVSVEAVHRLTELGAVVTHVLKGISPEGFNAEWRMIDVFTVEGSLLSRCEIFDESDLDAALARFDELSRPTPRLENAASRVHARLKAFITARDWNALTEIVADDIAIEDRRRAVNSGIQYGPDAAIADMRGAIELGLTNISLTVTATRGDRLELSRMYVSGEDAPDAFGIEFLSVFEINADGRLVARVGFDPDDIDAALVELDARYLAGEAAAHAHTWSVIANANTAFNRHEMPPTTPEWVNIDHRPVTAFGPGDMEAYIRATWDVAPDMKNSIVTVHRLTDLGAVNTQMTLGTSQEGFEAEWREIVLLTVDGDLLNRIEVFEETDLDAALTRFDELHRPEA